MNGLISTRLLNLLFIFAVAATGGDVVYFKYPAMTKTGAAGFKLNVVQGEFRDSEVIVLLGARGTGKTTFLRLLRGLLDPDTVEGRSDVKMIPKYISSHKTQTSIQPIYSSVSEVIHQDLSYACASGEFVSQVMEPLQINQLMDKRVCDISADEVERFKLCLCLGRLNAHIYLIDEPSANLSPQQRIVPARVIKTFIQDYNKTAFVVENDFAMVDHLADKVILFEGTPSVNCVAHAPQPWNLFLAAKWRPNVMGLSSEPDKWEEKCFVLPFDPTLSNRMLECLFN